MQVFDEILHGVEH